MPNIPVFTASPDAAAAPLPLAEPGAFAAPGLALAQSGAQLGNLGDEWEQHFIAAQRQALVGNKVADGVRLMGEAQAKWSRVADRTQALTGFNQDAQQIQQGVLQGVDDPEAAGLISHNLAMQAAITANQTGREAFERQSSVQVGQVRQSLLTYSNLGAAATDDLTRAHYRDLAMQTIHGSVAAGWMMGNEGSQLEIGYDNDVARGRAQQFMLENPGEAARVLADPAERQKMFPGLLPQEATQLGLYAVRFAEREEMHANAAQAHADAMAERQLRQTQASNFGALYGAIQQGKPLDVNQVSTLIEHQQLAPGMFPVLMAAQEKQAAGHDDPMTLLHAQEAAIDGTLTPDQIESAVTAGHLRGSTGGELMRTVAARQQQQATNVERHDYNTLRTEFSAQAIESGIFPGQDRDAATDLWAAAQREWTQRVVLKHENSSAVLQDMTAQYVPGKFLGAAPIAGPVTNAAQLNAVAVATVRMHQAGQLDDAAYQQQVTILNRYRALLALHDGVLPSGAVATPRSAAPKTPALPPAPGFMDRLTGAFEGVAQ